MSITSAALGAGGAVLVNHLLGTNTEGMSAKDKQDRLDLVNSIIGGVTEALGGDANAAVIAGKIEQENNEFSGNPFDDWFNLGNEIAQSKCQDDPS